MTSWLTQHFFNPSFVLPWGALLLTIPVIIHLINRMRYKRVRFAAMEFLLQSQQKNRRRLLLEQLLLLLLRMLAVALLVALLARLVLDPSEVALFQGAQAHHIVLIDDSGSMREELQEGTAFDKCLDAVRKLASEGAKRPNTIQLSLIKLSDPTQPILFKQTLNDVFLNELENRLENLESGFGQIDLHQGLESAGKLFQEEMGMKHFLHLISDFREADWLTPQALQEQFANLNQSEVSVNLIRTVETAQDNLAITNFEGDLHVAAADVPIRLRMSVKNFGETTAKNVRVSLFADGNKLPRSLLFEEIAPGVEELKEFDVKLSASGKHHLEVSLPEDILPADNKRFLAVDLLEFIPVLVVDGAPSQIAAEYVADALAADADLTGIDVQVESPEYLRLESLEKFSCIYLMDVAELSLDAVAALEKYVAGGGGLVWFMGDSINPQFYNDKLYDNPMRLFPVPLDLTSQLLEEVVLVETEQKLPDMNLASHPLFRVFSGQDNPFVDMVRIQNYLPVRTDWERDDNKRNDGVLTLGKLRNNAPFIFEHQPAPDSGKILTILTSAGPTWNNWAINPSFVIFQLELQKQIARYPGTATGYIVGEPINLSLLAADYQEKVEVVAPDESAERRVSLQAVVATPETSPGTPQEGGARLNVLFDDTQCPGLYQVELTTQDQIQEQRWLAYNVPVAESQLSLLTTEELFRASGEFDNIQIHEPGQLRWLEGRDAGEDVRKYLLFALLIGLLLEQMLAYKLSYHPKQTKSSRTR